MKRVYCPHCYRHVATHDEKSIMNIEVKCHKCKKLVVYKPESKETLIKDLPDRMSESGKRFY